MDLTINQFSDNQSMYNISIPPPVVLSLPGFLPLPTSSREKGTLLPGSRRCRARKRETRAEVEPNPCRLLLFGGDVYLDLLFPPGREETDSPPCPYPNVKEDVEEGAQVSVPCNA